jgi:endonuclease I
MSFAGSKYACEFPASIGRVCLLLALGVTGAGAQLAPLPQPLPYSLDFGTAPFSAAPIGTAAWGGLSGTAIDNETKAALSAPTETAGIAAATVAQSTGGVYGFSSDGDGRLYIQTSSNSANGVNQFALALDTSGWAYITLDYDVEILNAQPREVGLLCQYRVGSSGAWTTLPASSGSNPFRQSGGLAGVRHPVRVQLPVAASNQALVQVRWATWRGSQSGNSSGIAIDNIVVAGTVLGDPLAPPPGYYAAAEGLTGAALKNVLKTIAATGHQPYAYSATLNPLRAIHEDPVNPSNVITVYSGTSIAKNAVYFPDGGLNAAATWSREHLWPVSYGLDPENINPGATNGDAGPDYTDLFNLRPAIHAVNSERGNLYFDQATGGVTIPSLAPLCRYDSKAWQPADAEKGDIARAMFYMSVRYDGSDPGTIDLELSDQTSTTAGRFARLSTLLLWHEQDPVSELERRQNHLIFSSYQGNRNPFVDHPEFVGRVWGQGEIDDVTLIPPAPLPLFHDGPWSPLPTPGFLAQGLGTPYSGDLGQVTGTGSARFDDSGDRLTIVFDRAPGLVNYRLKGNPGSGSFTSGTFQVLESANGRDFSVIRTIENKSQTDEAYSDPLLPGSRFVAFLYQTKTTGNIQMDKLEISGAVTLTPWTEWLEEHELSGTDAEPGADPDADGFANLAEYGLGRSPVAPDPPDTGPRFERLADRLRITAVLRTDDPALTTTAEVTGNPQQQAWQSSAVLRITADDQTGVATGFERTIFEFEHQGAPRVFARLKFDSE